MFIQAPSSLPPSELELQLLKTSELELQLLQTSEPELQLLQTSELELQPLPPSELELQPLQTSEIHVYSDVFSTLTWIQLHNHINRIYALFEAPQGSAFFDGVTNGLLSLSSHSPHNL